jgi:hypothetical protein
MTDAMPAVEGLEQERNDFYKNGYPDVKFWMAWIEDKISAVDRIEELDRLFERAISDCPHVDIVKEFVSNAFDRLEAELMVRKCIWYLTVYQPSTCPDIMYLSGLCSLSLFTYPHAE